LHYDLREYWFLEPKLISLTHSLTHRKRYPVEPQFDICSTAHCWRLFITSPKYITSVRP